MPDFIPRKDADFLAFATNLLNVATTLAEELGIPQTVLSEIATTLPVYADAFERAYSPRRCCVYTQEKNHARKALERPIRTLSGLTLHTATMTQRLQMGLKPLRQGKAPPLPAPDTEPYLAIRGVHGHRLLMHISERTGRAKPRGVDTAIIHTAWGEHAPPGFGRGAWTIMTNRRHFVIDFPGELPPGTKVWVTAQWLNRGHKTGPLCRPVFQHLGAGGDLPRRLAA